MMVMRNMMIIIVEHWYVMVMYGGPGGVVKRDGVKGWGDNIKYGWTGVGVICDFW